MGLTSDLKILYHLALKPVRGKDHAARMENFYAGQAEAYDDFRKRLLKGRQELWNLIDPPPGGTWVDMGGGTGGNLEYFLQGSGVVRGHDVPKPPDHDPRSTPDPLDVVTKRVGWDKAAAAAGPPGISESGGPALASQAGPTLQVPPGSGVVRGRDVSKPADHDPRSTPDPLDVASKRAAVAKASAKGSGVDGEIKSAGMEGQRSPTTPDPAVLGGLGKIYVLDLSHSLLEVAKKRIAAKGWTNVETVEADATTFQPPTGPVDVVTFSYSLTMIPDWFAAIENALAILKPGGQIGVVDFYVSRKFPQDGLTRHAWSTRSFWPTWFAMDNVFPSPDHVPFLHRHFDALHFEEHRAKVPYIPLSRVPYYLFVGRKR